MEAQKTNQLPPPWDTIPKAFDEWWDSGELDDAANPFNTGTPAYWAWEGWKACARLTKE